MGILSLVMVASSIIFSFQGGMNLLVSIFIIIFFLFIFVPIFLNVSRIKLCAFLKGSVYVVYLAPTYVNILTIYAISNIHDVSWGSRPDNKDKKVEARFAKMEKKREINYKNYRSNFLIIWIMVNFAVAFCITRSSKNGDKSVIIGLGLFLVGLIAFKFFFCTLFILISLCKIRRSNNSGEFFKRVSCSFYLNYLTFRLL